MSNITNTTVYDDTFKSPNNSYDIRLGFYNKSDNRVDNLGNVTIETVTNITNPKFLSATAAANGYAPCISLEYAGNVNDDNTTEGFNLNDGFSCIFKADTPFFDNGGNNGCINFAWTNNSLGEDIIPEKSTSSNYNTATEINSNEENYSGLFDSLLGNSDMNGFSLTLYPSNEYECSDHGYTYTTQLSRYVLSYKLKNDTKEDEVPLEDEGSSELIGHKVGYLPINVNIFDLEGALPVNTELYVEHEYGYYNFYINGIMFTSVKDDSVNMDCWEGNDGFFTASTISIPYIDANIQIIDIGNSSTYLTHTEKTNIANLGVSVLNYYVENEEKDYTEAFQDALADTDVRRVYVPGGTYKITGELVVPDNCELELAQDAVLDFSEMVNSTDIKSDIDPDVGLDLWTEDDINNAKKCITLNMLSSLVGNHATIRVSDEFNGIVIYASTRSHPNGDSFKNIPPFSHYCPQWKPARYVSDINIVMPNSDGVHASDDGTCNGTAILVEGHRNNDTSCSSHLWGLEYTGLRIAGPFKYGVYGTNNYIMVDKLDGNGNVVKDKDGNVIKVEKWAWTNDMKINGLIEGCEVGVYLNHCNHAYISTSIQPKHATDDAKTKYAKYGIYLNNCVNANLNGSRIWDWDKTNTMWVAGGENQHIRLLGDCYGLILDDFSYYEMDDYDIRDLIYTQTPSNYENMTILQEPVSKFISFDTDKTKASLFVDRIIDTTEDNKGEVITNFGTTVSGMINCKDASNIIIDGLIPNNEHNIIVAYYDENYKYKDCDSVSHTTADSREKSFTNSDGASYFRFCYATSCLADDLEVTVDGVTTEFRRNYLKDGIYVKNEYVEE